jgi:putative flippase GtrA
VAVRAAVMAGQSLPSRAQALFERSLSLRYLVIGVANTAFGCGLYLLLLYAGFGVAAASALALVAGILVSYQTQGTITFRTKSTAVFLRFVCAWTIIYFANLGEIRLFQHGGLNAYWAGIVATVPTTIVSYFVQKAIVFRVRSDGGKK